MSKNDAEIALRGFWLYYNKYLKFHDGYILPSWYKEAEKAIGRDRAFEIYNQEVTEDQGEE